jgi:hypothetical protein
MERCERGELERVRGLAEEARRAREQAVCHCQPPPPLPPLSNSQQPLGSSRWAAAVREVLLIKLIIIQFFQSNLLSNSTGLVFMYKDKFMGGSLSVEVYAGNEGVGWH